MNPELNKEMTMPITGAVRPHHGTGGDYARNPLIVYWEMTQACGLACLHCRAEAMPRCHPDELTQAEGQRLLAQIASFGEPHPHLILTGGDPLRRADLYELIDEAVRLGLHVSITPSATPDLTYDTLLKLKAHGIESLGLSLDGSSAARHEAVRGVAGCFAWTMDAARNGGALGMPIQINTLVSQETVDDLPAIYELLTQYQISRWSLFFLIAIGRGKMLQPISADQGERLMEWVYDLAGNAPFAIKTTEAPSYRRVALNRLKTAPNQPEQARRNTVFQGFGIRDGHGIVFVSQRGDIYPSGFLPVAAGNVRHDGLADVYRHSELFRGLHNPDLFHGRCGECEYRKICGGSRARAFAYTGNPLESDPLCPYQPEAAHASAVKHHVPAFAG